MIVRNPPCEPGGDNRYSIRVSPGRQGHGTRLVPPRCSADTEAFVQKPSSKDINMRTSHSTRRGIGRRGFLGTAGTLAVSGTLGSTGRAGEKAGPNEKVGVGIIGVGSRGSVLLQNLLRIPGVEVRGVCDIDPEHLRRGRRWSRAPAPEPAGTEDWKELLKQPASTRSSVPCRATSISELPGRHRRRQGPLRREADVPDAGPTSTPWSKAAKAASRSSRSATSAGPTRASSRRSRQVHAGEIGDARRGPDPLVELLGAAARLVRPARGGRATGSSSRPCTTGT